VKAIVDSIEKRNREKATGRYGLRGGNDERESRPEPVRSGVFHSKKKKYRKNNKKE